MKLYVIAFALAASFVAIESAPAAERPNQPVYRNGPWFVVRSVRDAGAVVACTGFYRANRRVQLSKDTLAITTGRQEPTLCSHQCANRCFTRSWTHRSLIRARR